MAKYGKKSQAKVKKAMEEMKEGKLKSGRNGKKVTDPKQAIAIGLSEARKEGGKVAKKAVSGRTAKKSAPKKSTGRKSAKKSAKKTSKKRSK